MSLYNFETVDYDKQYPANVFVTHIGLAEFHWHYEYEICFVLKGTVKITYETNAQTYQSNDIVLINSRTVHCVESEEDNICVFIQLAPELFEKTSKDSSMIRKFYLDSVLDELKPQQPYSYFVKRVLRIAFESLNDSENSFFIGRAEIYQLIADFAEYVEFDIRSNAQPVDTEMEVVMRFLDYVREHLQSDTVLNDGLNNCGVAQRTLQRYLRKHLGLSMKETLDGQRLITAKRLLHETQKAVDYIIDYCGFGSEKTFYRLFKNETGMTPAEYRNQTLNRKVSTKKDKYLSYDHQEVLYLLQKKLEEF